MDIEGQKLPHRTKDCDLCTVDDENILVSVSPRCFTLPPASEKRTKIEIKNHNAYPIYFKAGSSNKDAFRPQPDTGRIPPNSKVSVVVQFYDSAVPLRRHEEVVVFTSTRPFEKFVMHKDNTCPYCNDSLHYSKYHHPRNIIHSAENFEDPEEVCCFSKCRLPQYTIMECKNEQHSKERVIDRMYASTTKKIKPSGGPQINFKSPEITVKHLDERSGMKKEHHQVSKSRHVDCKNELEEICLHTFVHRRTNRNCECGNCAELSFLPKDVVKIQDIEQAKTLKDRELSDPSISSTEHTVRELYIIPEKEQKSKKEVHTIPEENIRYDSKSMASEAHILARVLKANDSKEISDTETSELIYKDKKRKRRKIISEEDFKRIVEKAKMKKNRKLLEEESQSTTTTEDATNKEPERSPKKKEAELTVSKREVGVLLTSVDNNCTTILRLTWTNFVFLVMWLIIVFAFIVYVCLSPCQNGTHHARCFYHLFK